MAKGILGSVGILEVFDDNALILTSRTLTSSAFGMTTSLEEIRGGLQNALLGKYYHTGAMTLNIEDAIYDMQYLALVCGGSITAEGDIIKNEELATTDTSGKVTLTEQPLPLQEGSNVIPIWWKLPSDSDDKYQMVVGVAGSKEVTISDITTMGTNVCVKYVYNDTTVRKFRVPSSFIPSIVHARLSIPIFKSSVSGVLGKESRIGTLFVNIPQLQLDGSIDLSLTASGVSTIPLTGSALANFTGSCDGTGWYAEISEKIENITEFSNISRIAVANSDLQLKTLTGVATLQVLGLFTDGTAPKLLENSKLTFTVKGEGTSTVDPTGKVTSGSSPDVTEIEVKVTSKPTLTAYAVVTTTA